MRVLAFRLLPGQDLREEIERKVQKENIKAGCMLTCVGSLTQANLRLANEKTKLFKESFEIVSLVGTLSQDGCHLHLSIANKEGKTFGGHLKKGCTIYTTAEIILADLKGLEFKRKLDPRVGWKELFIKTKE